MLAHVRAGHFSGLQQGHSRSRRPELRGWRPSSGYPLGICHMADVIWSVLWLSCGAPEYDFGCFDYGSGKPRSASRRADKRELA
jgi:hypothetical protein